MYRRTHKCAKKTYFMRIFRHQVCIKSKAKQLSFNINKGNRCAFFDLIVLVFRSFSPTRLSLTHYLTDNVMVSYFGHISIVCESTWTFFSFATWDLIRKPFLMVLFRISSELSFCGPCAHCLYKLTYSVVAFLPLCIS